MSEPLKCKHCGAELTADPVKQWDMEPKSGRGLHIKLFNCSKCGKATRITDKLTSEATQARTQVPFRDTERAEKGGLIIAEDILCDFCGLPAPTENPHRKCLDMRVIETFQGAITSNEAVVASNKELGEMLLKLNETLMKLVPNPPTGSFTVITTVPPPATPSAETSEKP